jgi:hypothetical protein
VRYAKGPKGDDGACRGSCVRCSAGCTCHRHGGMTKWAGGDYAKRKSPVYYIPRYETGLDEIEQTRKIRKEDFYNKKKKLSNRNRSLPFGKNIKDVITLTNLTQFFFLFMLKDAEFKTLFDVFLYFFFKN